MNKADRAPAGNGAEWAAVVSCWMCGVRRHFGQMVPDGGSACDDIRWYCRDARACTERWTASRHTLAQANAGQQDDRSELITSEASAANPDDAAPLSGLDAETSALPAPPG